MKSGLQAYAGKPVGVLVRTAAEMAQVLADNPFPKAAPNRTMAVFLDRAPPADTLAGIRGQKDEEIRLGTTGDLHPLRRGHGQIQARHCRGQSRHRAQHEYGRGARQDGRRILTCDRALSRRPRLQLRQPGMPPVDEIAQAAPDNPRSRPIAPRAVPTAPCASAQASACRRECRSRRCRRTHRNSGTPGRTPHRPAKNFRRRTRARPQRAPQAAQTAASNCAALALNVASSGAA